MNEDQAGPRGEESALAGEWWDKWFGEESSVWPFSFLLDGKVVNGPAAGWECEREERELDDCRDELTLTAKHPDCGLTVRCVAVRYRDFPVIEWTAHLEQEGSGASPEIKDVLALDAAWQSGEKSEFVLRSYVGDDHRWRSIYQPVNHDLWPDAHRTFSPFSHSDTPDGRGSSGVFPYFAVEQVSSYVERRLRQGFLMAIGWPGRWQAEFSRDWTTGLRIRAGQDKTHFRLQPGETFRTPLVALLFHGGDRLRAANLWRRWMIKHNLPRVDGRLPEPMLEATTCGFLEEMGRATEANQIEHIDRHLEAKLPITHWWMDAGWYQCQLAGQEKNLWVITGTWEADRKRFPGGMGPITAHLRRHNLKTILWFEPERVMPGTWLHQHKPQWLLTHHNQRPFSPETHNFWDSETSYLLDLGNAGARQWLLDHVSSLIESEGVDVYRQDFNFNPLPFWRDNDASASSLRHGLTENRHISGYLAWWDALRQRFGHLLLDSCASGGRRVDLESMRRAIVLHPTDHLYDDLPVKQAMRHTLFQWLPFFGGPIWPMDRVDTYAFRSTMGLSTIFGYNLSQPLDLDLLRKLIAEWHEAAPYYYGDFYPLTSYSLEEDVWMAWQFHRPEHDDGLIQIFRRPESPHESATFPLHGLNPSATYEFKDFDESATTRHTGAELTEGWGIAIPERRTAKVIQYRKVIN